MSKGIGRQTKNYIEIKVGSWFITIGKVEKVFKTVDELVKSFEKQK